MPSKSRRSKRKLLQSKKRKSQRSPSPVAIQQPATAQAYEPVTPSNVVAPSVKVPAPVPTAMAVRRPHIVTELRTIGILAGIILVILVVLALVLP